MTTPLSRAFVSDIEVRSDGTGRTVHGIIVPFGRTARVSDGGPSYNEAFERGAFSKTIADRGDKVKLLSQHNSRRNPLGRATLLREDTAGLYGEFHVSRTTAGDEALELLKDGALDSFSVGFGGIRQEKRDGVVWRTEVALREASLVTFPAYEGALVAGVRSWSALSDDEREELAALYAAAIELRSTTLSGPEIIGTSTHVDAAATESEPVAVTTPGDHLKSFRHSRKIAREKGVIQK